ncbi:MAG: hypothetical protein LC105_00510 [Chitinophagales bacterium]|nr:hypothetical protein [Chitinophagales bacterium]MCZ2392326.1 hypothetical protein [Chitinophagales bacterium]
MRKTYLLILFVAFSGAFFTSCKKDELQVQERTVKSNLTQDQENDIFNEVSRMVKETPEISARERELIDELRTWAIDVEAYYEGVDDEPTWEAKYNRIRANMHQTVDAAAAKASIFYGGNEGKTILAKNSYVLMSYDAMEKYMNEFLWTKLGLFAANEVRNGIVLSYTLREVLKKTKIDLAIDGISGVNLSDVLFESTRILMDGQISVFTDIGALGLLNRKYGQEPFLDASWLTQEARNGYAIQKQAEAALANGNINEYQNLQTEAAIWFGAHEQLYTLDPLWQTEIMGIMAQLNIWMHDATKGGLALFGDIFIGTNKFGEFLLGNTIKIPLASHDLRKGEDRVGIAINGFNTLNEMRKTKRWAPWIEYSQKRLGYQQGVYNVNFRP